MDHFDQDIYHNLPVEIWKHIIDSDIDSTLNLLFCCKQFIGLVCILTNNLNLLNLLVKRGNLKFLEFYFGFNTETNKSYTDQRLKTELNECLKMSCIHGRLEILKHLISKGVNFRIDDDEPLMLAVENGHLEIVQFLYGKRVNIRSRNNRPLILSCEKGYIDIVNFLLDKKVSFVSKQNEVFSTACRFGQMDIIKLLIEKGADIDSGKISPIISAAQGGHLNVIEHLVSKGASINKHRFDALFAASLYGHLNVVKYLLGYINDSNIIYYAFEKACLNGHINIVQYLFSENIITRDIIIENSNTKYLLYHTIRNKHKHIIKILIENDIIDKDKKYPDIIESAPKDMDPYDYLIKFLNYQ